MPAWFAAISDVFLNGVRQMRVGAIDLIGAWSVTYNPTTGRLELSLAGGGGTGADPAEVAIAGSTLTLDATHRFKRLRCTNVAGCSITVPDSVFAATDWVEAYASMTGQKITFVQGGAQAIASAETLKTRKEFSLARVSFRSAATSLLTGDLELAP